MFTLLLSVAAAEDVTYEDLTNKGGGVWIVETSTTIDAPADTVNAYLGDLSTWKDWTAWTAERDPECVWDYTGEPLTTDHTMHWVGPEMGEGWVEMTAVSDGEIRYDLWFTKKSMDPSKGIFTVSEADGVTTVTWGTAGKTGFIGRLFKKKIEEAIMADFVEGLEGVKAAAEADHAAFLKAEEERIAAEKAAEEARLAEEAAKEAEEAAEGEEEAAE